MTETDGCWVINAEADSSNFHAMRTALLLRKMKRVIDNHISSRYDSA